MINVLINIFIVVKGIVSACMYVLSVRNPLRPVCCLSNYHGPHEREKLGMLCKMSA
jgi:hypothetical protein